MKKWIALIALSLAWLLVACAGTATDVEPATANGAGEADAPTVLVYRSPT
jgi:hypothetical protein